MSVQDKAKEFINKFDVLINPDPNTAYFPMSINCAEIAVDEIIKELESVEFNYGLEDSFKELSLTPTVIRYYKEVKEELKKIKNKK